MAGSGGTGSGETTISDLTRVRFSNLDKIMYPSMQITKERSHRLLHPRGSTNASIFI